jgi:hypothetical protein
MTTKPNKATLEEGGSARFICFAIARLDKNLYALRSVVERVVYYYAYYAY